MRRKALLFIVGINTQGANHFVAEPKLPGSGHVPHRGCENAVFQGGTVWFTENTQLDLIRSIAALEQREPHVSSVFELLDVEVDLQFLLSVGSRSQFPSDEAVR